MKKILVLIALLSACAPYPPPRHHHPDVNIEKNVERNIIVERPVNKQIAKDHIRHAAQRPAHPRPPRH